MRNTGLWMFALAWAVFFALVFAFSEQWFETQRNPNSSVSSLQAADGTQVVSLQRNKYGQYRVTGAINGTAAEFLVDTGATSVAVPEKLARRLGLARGLAQTVQTAGGIVVAYNTSLHSVRVGALQVSNVPAVIVPELDGQAVLLGMSFLRHIEFSQSGDQLILRQCCAVAP